MLQSAWMSMTGILVLASTAAAGPSLLSADTSMPSRFWISPAPTGAWSVYQAGEEGEIRFGPATEIELAQPLIAATPPPLLGVALKSDASATVLRLGIGCDCRLAVARIGPPGTERLAIDILPIPPGPRVSTDPIAAPPPSPRPVATDPGDARAVLPSEIADPRQVDEAVLPVDPMGQARARLLEQLERAAEAGIIDLAERSVSDEERDDMPAVAAQQRETPAPASEPEPAQDSEPSIVAGPEEEIRAATGPARHLAVPPGRPECAQEADLALQPPGPDFVERQSSLRVRLVGEFDRADIDAAEALARHYLNHGLGAEAYRIAEDHDIAPRRQALLATLALAIDGRPLPEGHALSAEDCGPRAEAWRALVEATAGNVDQAITAARRGRPAIEEMAEPLRTRLAAALGNLAAVAGRWSDARAMRAIARRGDRMGAPATPERRLLDARIAEASGDAEMALALYRDLWADGGEPGAEAMIAIAGLLVDGRLPAAADTHLLRLDLGAVARERRGDDLGMRALRAEAALRHATFGREAAVELLAFGVEAGLIDPADRADTVARLALAQSAEPSDPLAIAYELAPERYRGALGDPGFRRALARSYAAVGLAGRAEGVLRSVDRADPKLLLEIAQAYQAQGAARETLRLLQALPESPRRAEIQAAAQAAVGSPGAALAELTAADAGTPELRARLAWAAADWPAAAEALSEAIANQPDPALAARLALARQRAGDRTPDAFAATTGIGAAADLEPFQATRDGVERLLGDLHSETQMLRELLNDG